MNKKAFTLIEVIISITIFSIVMAFLYKSLDQSKKFNESFSTHVDNYIDTYDFQKILNEDIIETKNGIKLDSDKDGNTILLITESNNTYHNVFNKYITYLLSKENNLLRIESQKEFKKNEIKSDFYDDSNTYIDLVAKDIKSFLVVQNKKERNGFTIYITTQKNKDYLFSTKMLIP